MSIIAAFVETTRSLLDELGYGGSIAEVREARR
jgi:hypothetical protein